MHRRTAVTATLATLLVVTPTAAHAYSASDYVGYVSTSSPTVGEGFTVTIEGPAAASVILTVTSTPAEIPDSAIDIAGTKSLAKTTDAEGDAVYTLVLSQAGTYSLVGTDAASGAVIFNQAVQVAGSTDGSVPAAADPEGTSGTGGLAVTGSATAPLAIGALLLVALGAAGIVLRRRRAAIGRP